MTEQVEPSAAVLPPIAITQIVHVEEAAAADSSTASVLHQGVAAGVDWFALDADVRMRLAESYAMSGL